jgi:thiol-disulfide isomerase/thioredoxin
MNQRRLLLGAGLGVAGAVALGAGVYVGLRAGVARPDSDAATALFAQRLPDVAGTATDLSRWLGHRLVVNFWATWCAPCVDEMPALQAFSVAQHGTDITVIGIAIDSADKVAAFAKRLGIDYPLYVAGADGLDLLRALGHPEASLPFTVIVDRQQKIRQRIIGRVDPAQLSAQLSRLDG